MDYKAIQAFLEYRNFQFNRPFRSKGDAYTFDRQFLGYHENDVYDYKRCLEKWLSVCLGAKWYEMLRDGADLKYFDFVERQDIVTAWKYWNELSLEDED